MNPLRGDTILLRSSQQLSLSPSRTHEGLFELTRRPSRALDSPRVLLPELQRYIVQEVPGRRQQQLTQTLIVLLLKPHFNTNP